MADADKSGLTKAISERSPITIGLGVVLIGFAFWMGVQHSQLSELNTFMRGMLADHESRLRTLEKRP